MGTPAALLARHRLRHVDRSIMLVFSFARGLHTTLLYDCSMPTPKEELWQKAYISRAQRQRAEHHRSGAEAGIAWYAPAMLAKTIRLLFVLLLLAHAKIASARVLRVEVASREDVLSGKNFGDVGPYERIAGTIYFSLPLDNVHNAAIVDLKNAVNLRKRLISRSRLKESSGAPTAGIHRRIQIA